MQALGGIMGRFVTYVIDPAILVVFAAGFFLFIWGLVQFLWNLNSGGDNKEGKQHMIWGVVGMLIMISVYGILSLLDNTFGFGALSGQMDMSRFNDVTVPGNFFSN